MMRRMLFALMLLLVTVPLFAGDFDQVARAIEKRGALQRQWIPFLGLARTFVRAAAPDGVHDFQLAVYERSNGADWAGVEQSFIAAAGSEYQPFVTTRERSGESTKILARPRGKLLELLILTRDSEDTVLIRVVADPERAKNIDIDHDFR